MKRMQCKTCSEFTTMQELWMHPSGAFDIVCERCHAVAISVQAPKTPHAQREDDAGREP